MKKRFVDETEFVFKLNGIAAELGMSVSTLQRQLRRKQINLSHWSSGKTSALYVSKGCILILKTMLLRSRSGKRRPAQ